MHKFFVLVGAFKKNLPHAKKRKAKKKRVNWVISLLTSLLDTCMCAFRLLVQLSYENRTGPIMVPESICLGYRVSLRSVLDTEYSDLWESSPMYMLTPASLVSVKLSFDKPKIAQNLLHSHLLQRPSVLTSPFHLFLLEFGALWQLSSHNSTY